MSGDIPRAFNRRDENITIENTRLLSGSFRNFEGKEGKYNRAGDRSCAVILPEDLAHIMEDAGWKVKYLKPREEGDVPQPYISVAVSFKGRHPRIVMITQTTRRRTVLEEDTCEVLDYADIASVDITIRPYHWNVNGETGTKAYLQTIFAIIEEDYLELKYADWDQPAAISGSTRELEQYDYLDGEVINEHDGPLAIEGRR